MCKVSLGFHTYHLSLLFLFFCLFEPTFVAFSCLLPTSIFFPYAHHLFLYPLFPPFFFLEPTPFTEPFVLYPKEKIKKRNVICVHKKICVFSSLFGHYFSPKKIRIHSKMKALHLPRSLKIMVSYNNENIFIFIYIYKAKIYYTQIFL